METPLTGIGQARVDLPPELRVCLCFDRPQLQIKRVSTRENAANPAKPLAYNSRPAQVWAVKVDT